MVEGSDASPKGVADVEVSLDSVVNKIRDRRDAVIDGRVTPSTVPHFPNAPMRQSLVSIDDEEIKTYRIEVTTDNVIKQSVPARFSESETEEYVAEFDMVDTDGEVIVPPPQIARARTPKKSPARESAKGLSLFKLGSHSKEESSHKIGSTKKSRKSVNSHSSKASGGGPLAALRKRTYSLEEQKNVEDGIAGGDETKDSSQDVLTTPPRTGMTVRDLVESPTPQAENETAADTKSMESKAPETKPSDAVSAPQSTEAKTDPVQQQETRKDVEQAKSTPKRNEKKIVEAKSTVPHVGGLFASFRKRTHSGKSSPPKSGATEIHHPPAVSKATQAKDEGLAETSKVEVATPVCSPARKKSERAVSPQVSASEVNKTTPAQGSTSTPVDLDDSVVPSVEPEGVTKEGKVKGKSAEDDDTKSMTTSSTETVGPCKPPMKIPGEAAVERLLERFFEKVTCTCITDKCVAGDDKELPNYMVVEIQKVHQKAQAKKAEIAEKKQARRASRKTDGSVTSSSVKGSAKSKILSKAASKKDVSKTEKKTAIKSLFEMKPESPSRKPVPTYEWGEKISAQDSFTTVETPKEPAAAGFTVSDYLQKKFGGIFDKSTSKNVSDDEQSEAAEEAVVEELDVVEESDADEDSVDHLMNGAILNILSVSKDEVEESSLSRGGGTTQSLAPKAGASQKDPEETVIILSEADDMEDGSESLLDAEDNYGDAGGDSLLDDEASEYTTELIQVDFDPSKLGNTTDADMYLAREVLRRYAEITGISLDELIEDVVDESLASLTLDAYGFPMDREGSML